MPGRSLVRPAHWQIVLAGATYAAMSAGGWADPYRQLPLTVLILGLGSVPSQNWTTHTDLSYGIHIYAFPIQHIFVLLGTASWGMIVNSILVLQLPLPLALLSWRVVEKPPCGPRAAPRREARGAHTHGHLG